jgi:protein ImuA
MTAAKEDIISKLRQYILQWEGLRLPQPGTTRDIVLGEIEKAFLNGIFPTEAIHEFTKIPKTEVAQVIVRRCLTTPLLDSLTTIQNDQ